MTYLPEAVKKPVTIPEGKTAMQHMRDLAAVECRKCNLSGWANSQANDERKKRREELEAMILAHVPAVPVRVAVIARAAGVTHDVAIYALSRMEADGRVIQTGKRGTMGTIVLKLYAKPTNPAAGGKV